MGHRAIHLDSAHGLFARFFGTPDPTGAVNLFRVADQASFDASRQVFIGRVNDLVSAGLAIDDGSGNVLVALRGLLVLPDPAPEGGAPLVMIAHGQAPATLTTLSQASEVRSYLGYCYLQAHLADQGLASLSVNLNVQNHLELDEDYLHRVEILLLHWVLLRSLAGQPPSSADPLFVLRSGRSQPSPLQEVLALSPPFTRGSPEARVHDLRGAVGRLLDLSRAAVLGHSRGANAAADLYQFFSGSAGSSPQPRIDRGSLGNVNP